MGWPKDRPRGPQSAPHEARIAAGDIAAPRERFADLEKKQRRFRPVTASTTAVPTPSTSTACGLAATMWVRVRTLLQTWSRAVTASKKGEAIVGHHPPGAVYRLIVGETGAYVARREPDTQTADAGLASVVTIQAANERPWIKRK